MRSKFLKRQFVKDTGRQFKGFEESLFGFGMQMTCASCHNVGTFGTDVTSERRMKISQRHLPAREAEGGIRV